MKVICKLYFPLHDKLHIGPSGVRAPAVSTLVATILGNFGPSGVRALPLAAGINVLVRAECVHCSWLLA